MAIDRRLSWSFSSFPLPMKQSHCLKRFLRSLSGCLLPLTPPVWALEFQSRSSVKLNQFTLRNILSTNAINSSCNMTVKKKKSLILTSSYKKPVNLSFQHSRQRSEFYLKMTALWLMIFFFVLTLPDEQQCNWSF